MVLRRAGRDRRLAVLKRGFRPTRFFTKMSAWSQYFRTPSIWSTKHVHLASKRRACQASKSAQTLSGQMSLHQSDAGYTVRQSGAQSTTISERLESAYRRTQTCPPLIIFEKPKYWRIIQSFKNFWSKIILAPGDFGLVASETSPMNMLTAVVTYRRAECFINKHTIGTTPRPGNRSINCRSKLLAQDPVGLRLYNAPYQRWP